MKESLSMVKLWELIFRLSDKLHQSCDRLHDRELVEAYHSLTLSQLKAVKAVKRLTDDEPGGVGLKLLSQELGTSPAATSELVNVLVNKGLLEREQSSIDRRAVCIRLSGLTRSAVARVHEDLDMQTERFLSGLSPGEGQVLRELLEKYMSAMDMDGKDHEA